MNREVCPLHPLLYEDTVRRALKEDLGRVGDITTDAVISPDAKATAQILTRSAGCLAGIDITLSVFTLLDPQVNVQPRFEDGCKVSAGDILAELRGSAKTLLQGERTALNFLGHLSGIATATRGIVNQINDAARVLCTRKTTPGLGVLEKYAVRAGGGFNHRFGLDDAVLIKENHLAIAGSIAEVVGRVRGRVGHMIKVEVEVETLEQLEEALRQDIDAVLLDNMSLDEIRQAVQMAKGRVLIEVSGGITPESAVGKAEAGADLLSIGWLTHSAPSLDVALDLQPVEKC